MWTLCRRPTVTPWPPSHPHTGTTSTPTAVTQGTCPPTLVISLPIAIPAQTLRAILVALWTGIRAWSVVWQGSPLELGVQEGAITVQEVSIVPQVRSCIAWAKFVIFTEKCINFFFFILLVCIWLIGPWPWFWFCCSFFLFC